MQVHSMLLKSWTGYQKVVGLNPKMDAAIARMEQLKQSEIAS